MDADSIITFSADLSHCDRKWSAAIGCDLGWPCRKNERMSKKRNQVKFQLSFKINPRVQTFLFNWHRGDLSFIPVHRRSSTSKIGSIVWRFLRWGMSCNLINWPENWKHHFLRNYRSRFLASFSLVGSMRAMQLELKLLLAIRIASESRNGIYRLELT